MENKKEVWKDVIGYEGRYQVSNLGNVKSLNRTIKYVVGDKKRTKISKSKNLIRIYVNGYCRVRLYSVGSIKPKLIYIHRLVASAFLYNLENKPQVNHKNMVRDDNRVENLEWCTSSENNKHSYDNSNRSRPIGEKSNGGKLKEVDVLKIRSIISEKSMTIKEMALLFNVDRMTISHIKHRKSWTHI